MKNFLLLCLVLLISGLAVANPTKLVSAAKSIPKLPRTSQPTVKLEEKLKPRLRKRWAGSTKRDRPRVTEQKQSKKVLVAGKNLHRRIYTASQGISVGGKYSGKEMYSGRGLATTVR